MKVHTITTNVARGLTGHRCLTGQAKNPIQSEVFNSCSDPSDHSDPSDQAPRYCQNLPNTHLRPVTHPINTLHRLIPFTSGNSEVQRNEMGIHALSSIGRWVFRLRMRAVARRWPWRGCFHPDQLALRKEGGESCSIIDLRYDCQFFLLVSFSPMWKCLLICVSLRCALTPRYVSLQYSCTLLADPCRRPVCVGR